MAPSILSPQVQTTLKSLHAVASRNDPWVRQMVKDAGLTDLKEAEFFKAMGAAYMAVQPEFGNLIYCLAQSSRAQMIVEFGTSFGVSTIYLACAIRDNGLGKVITTEFEPTKVDWARQNLAAAGLEEFVEFRIGDALETLKVDIPQQIDLIFLDGAKSKYLDVLRLLEPNLRRGGIIASDNTDQEALKPFMNYVRGPGNGYTSSSIQTGDSSHQHEITVRN